MVFGSPSAEMADVETISLRRHNMLQRGLGILVLVLTVATTPGLAQDVQNPDTGDDSQAPKTENPPEPESHGSRMRWKDLPRNLWHDQKGIVSSPLHINRDNAKLWALFGLGTAALLATDKSVSTRLPNEGAAKSASKWASRVGANYAIYPLTTIFYLYGKADGNPRARDTARLGIEALAGSEITVNALKLITQRGRPETRESSIAFFHGGDSFPSGHSIQAWALARVVAREFGEHKVVPILAYGLATTVAASRVAGRRHSPSDAFVGAAMGYFIGDYVYRHHHAPSEKSKVAVWVADHVSFGFQSRVQPPSRLFDYQASDVTAFR